MRPTLQLKGTKMSTWFWYVLIGTMFFFWGVYVGKRINRTNTNNSPEKDQSRCSCGHPYSMHKDNGFCNVTKIKYEYGSYKNYPCACIRYDGIPPAHVFMKDV